MPHGPATASPRSTTRTPASGDAGAGVMCAPRAWRPRARRLRRAPCRCAHRSRPARSGRVGGARVQVVHAADLADRAELGVVDLDDAAVGDEAGSCSASSGDRSGCSGTPTSAPSCDPRLRRELGDRLGHQRLVVVQQEHLVDVHADARGRVAGTGGLLRALERVALGRAEHEVGERHPLVHPPAVGAAEHALRCARVADPALVVRGVDVLDALPRRQRGGEHALEQRRRHALAAAGLLAHAQRGADRERGQVGRRHAHPRHARVAADRDGARPPSSRRARRGRGTQAATPARRASVPPGTPRLSHWWPVRAATSASTAGRSACAPSSPYAVIEQCTRRGLRASSVSWSMPSCGGDAGREVLDEHVGVRCECERPARDRPGRRGRAPRCACRGATPARR